MNADELSQKLAALSAQEQGQAAEQYPPPNVPPGAPNVARMYTAILRENWTPTEWDLVQHDAQIQRMYHNTLENAWYPTMDQLRQYSNGELSGDLLADIEYHLEIDKCLHSLRLLGAIESEDFPGIGPASFSSQPLELVAGMGFASGDEEPKTLIDDDQTRLVHDPQADQFRLSSKVHAEGTLLHVMMIGADGQRVWQRFVLLWDKFRDQVMGRCEAPTPDAELDSETRKHNSIICVPVDLETLAEVDAVTLEQSWTWSRENQASSVDAWKKLAAELKQKSIVKAIKAVADRME